MRVIETITFKVPKEISDKFEQFADSHGKTQNAILKKWLAMRPFPFARKMDMSAYADQSLVSKTIRLREADYIDFKKYCVEQGVDMRELLICWMHVRVSLNVGVFEDSQKDVLLPV